MNLAVSLQNACTLLKYRLQVNVMQLCYNKAVSETIFLTNC